MSTSTAGGGGEGLSKWRLFVGNLAPSVDEGELRGKFESLLSSHPDAELGQVEVRCKNEDNFFGFVNIHTKRMGVGRQDGERPPPYLCKCE
jgi:hypothetical protein